MKIKEILKESGILILFLISGFGGIYFLLNLITMGLIATTPFLLGLMLYLTYLYSHLTGYHTGLHLKAEVIDEELKQRQRGVAKPVSPTGDTRVKRREEDALACSG